MTARIALSPSTQTWNVGHYSGTNEQDVNYEIASLLAPILRAAGVECDIMTAGRGNPGSGYVANAVKHQFKESQDLERNKLADVLTTASFTFQLTSPSQMFMNATQVMFVTFPELAAKYGAKQAAAELNRAAKQYFQSGFDLLSADKGKDGKQKAVLRTSADPADSALLQALTRIKENGPLDITQAV